MYDPSKKEWVLVLNKYQRDNLLWLLNACGFPAGSGNRVEPFTCADTGDWLGEVCLMLVGESPYPGVVAGDRPNVSFDVLRHRVESWVQDWVARHSKSIEPCASLETPEVCVDSMQARFKKI